MISGFVVVALALLALTYVAVPLRSGVSKRPEIPPRSLEEAAARKRAAIGALVELDEDAAVGKISAADLERLRSQYETEAVRALIELDRAESEPIASDELENEIRAFRDRMLCPSCGAVRSIGEPCPRCGA